jgi:hypothetical protein
MVTGAADPRAEFDFRYSTRNVVSVSAEDNERSQYQSGFYVETRFVAWDGDSNEAFYCNHRWNEPINLANIERLATKLSGMCD